MGRRAHSILTTLFLILPILLVATAWFHGDDAAMRWSLAGLAIYLAAPLPMLMSMEWAMRSIATSRGQPKNWISLLALVKLPFAGLLTQALYTGATVSAMFFAQGELAGSLVRFERTVRSAVDRI